jgi:hypothetical protein
MKYHICAASQLLSDFMYVGTFVYSVQQKFHPAAIQDTFMWRMGQDLCIYVSLSASLCPLTYFPEYINTVSVCTVLIMSDKLCFVVIE